MISRVAVIGLKRIGDAVYTLPLLQALFEQKQVEITVFTEPQVAALYEGASFIHAIKSYPKKAFWKSTLADLKKEDYQACLVLHNAFKYAALPFLAGIPMRVGYQKELRGWMLTHKLPLPKSVVHRLEHNARLGDLMGVEARGILPKVALTAAESTTQLDFLQQYGVKEQGYIAFIVGSIAPTRRWFPENFAEVAHFIVKVLRLKVVILGGPDDVSIATEVTKRASLSDEDLLNLAGETSLRETMRFFASAKVVVSNDTGPMHVASAMGVPVVTWFGAANELEIKPPSPKTTVLNAHVACSPCVKEVCSVKTLACLHQITPLMVQQALNKIIKDIHHDSSAFY